MHRRQRNKATLGARVLLRAAMVGAIFAVAMPAATPGASAASSQTLQTSLSFSLSTSSTTLGPFVTTQPATVAVDANDAVRVNGASVTFGALDVEVEPGFSFTVTLTPTSDLTGAIDPTGGGAMLAGQFMMVWQSDALPRPGCEVGPFTVNASTAPAGSSLYSPASGGVTMLDAAPSVPESQFCAGIAMVDEYVPLPVTPPAQPAPPGTVPDPAWTVSALLSPPLQPPPPTTTSTSPPTSPPTGTHTPTATSPPAPTASGGPASVAPIARQPGRPAQHSKAKTKASTTTATTIAGENAAPIDPSQIPYPLPLSTADVAGPLNGPISGTSGAIDPLAVGAKDPSSWPLMVGGLVLVIAAIAFALPLIGRDIRGMLPRRSRQRFGGPIGTPIARGANRSAPRQS